MAVFGPILPFDPCSLAGDNATTEVYMLRMLAKLVRLLFFIPALAVAGLLSLFAPPLPPDDDEEVEERADEVESITAVKRWAAAKILGREPRAPAVRRRAADADAATNC
jgi:hypothetical protein